MINPGYLKYIPAEKQEEIHQSLLRDVHYFYYVVKPKALIIQKDEKRVNILTENLGVI